MLLASTPSSRLLHCAAPHMEEPNKQAASLILPLPEVCCSSSGQDAKEASNTLKPSFRPRSEVNSLTSTSIIPDADTLKISKPISSLIAVPGDSAVGSEEEETCSNTSSSKATTSSSVTAQGQICSLNEAEVAVREDDEDNCNEEGRESYNQRQSPSPSSSFQRTKKSMRTQTLTPALKLGDNSQKKGRHCRTRRRIRGIWGDDTSSQFSQLHDETLFLIMKHLSMKDLCAASMVCQRFKQVSLHQDVWKRIDATGFVHATYDHFVRNSTSQTQSEAPKSTSLALTARIERYSPDCESLSIHSIQHRLSADNFLSSLPSLQELTLASFAELTDTHIHVLLLSLPRRNVQDRSKRSCRLRKLVLEHCPRLTDATVQSIGKLCPDLEELSLKGSPKVTDLTPLKELWYLVKKPSNPRVASTASTIPPGLSSLAAMSMLFNPPPPVTPAPVPAPPRPSTPTNSLQSLFAPPGHSPPRTTNVISVLPRTLSNASNVTDPGKLTRLDVSNTGVSAKTLLKSWEAVHPGSNIRLQKLFVGGSGRSWDDKLLQQLAETIDLPKLRSLNLGCGQSTSRLTDKGLRSLLLGKDSLRSLKHLDLTGHASLTATGVAELLAAVSTTLEELVLDGCKSLSSKSASPAIDFANCDALGKAILKCTTRERYQSFDEKAKGGGRGLRRLSLARCFSDRSKLQKNNNLRMHEETMGTFLLEAIGPKQKKKKSKASNGSASVNTSTTTSTIGTLRELDLTDCWFVTSSDITSLQKRCPYLDTIHLQGTRAHPAN